MLSGDWSTSGYTRGLLNPDSVLQILSHLFWGSFPALPLCSLPPEPSVAHIVYLLRCHSQCLPLRQGIPPAGFTVFSEDLAWCTQ